MTIPRTFSRRSFLVASTSAAGGLLLSIRVFPADAGAKVAPSLAPHWLNLWVGIDPDGTVTISVPKIEQGQGVRTSIPMILADELDAPWDDVVVDLAPLRGDAAYGWQGVGGSTTIWTLWEPLRQAGATAREMLKVAGALQWEGEPSECHTQEGWVVHPPTGRRLSYGALARAASEQPVPRDPPLKDPSEFRIIGTSRDLMESRQLAEGSAGFCTDVREEGMAFAAIARAPAIGARVVAVSEEGAVAVTGVEAVVPVHRTAHPMILADGVAVLADNTWSALKGRERLEVEWEESEGREESSHGLLERFRELVDRPGEVIREDGDFDGAIRGAALIHEADYEAPFLAHAPMDPGSFYADVREDRVVFRGPMQAPEDVAGIAAQITGLPPQAVDVQMHRQGGSFGRRLSSDGAAEAIARSKAAGRPVKMVWTREDDLRYGTFRPTSRHRLMAGLEPGGKVIAWRHRQASTSRYGYQDSSRHPASSEFYPDDPPAGMVPNYRLEYTPVDSLIPRGPWRSVIHSQGAFAVESFTDEVAHAAGQDPLELRMRLLGEDRELPYSDHGGPVLDTGRLRRVLEAAAERAGWGRYREDDRALGIAGRFTFGSYAAQVAEVSVDGAGRVTVHRVFAAIDAGIPVNPRGLRAQVEGGVAFGLSAALFNEIHVDAGRVRETNFHDHPILRFSQMPEVEIHIVDSPHAPKGAGETSVPPVAPAVANAIYSATGVRIRKPPFSPEAWRRYW
jgi:isoquinoline 1-oxidoreductase beta subunit